MNSAIVEMDDLTQQNTGLVEEAAAAAQALQNQAAALAEVVGVFKLTAHAVNVTHMHGAPARARLNEPTLRLAAGS